MKVLRWVFLSAVVLSLPCCPVASAQNQTADQQPANSATKHDEQALVGRVHGHMGVGVEPLHSSLVNHLSSLIGGEYGLLVDEVVEGSPAAMAGVKPNDVILRYDDQKLFSPEQLAKLVYGDKPGHVAALGIIRGGQPQTIKVTLGEEQVLTAARPRRAFRAPLLDRPARPLTVEEQEAGWTMFDSMTLTQDSENHFKAQIKYRDNQGKVDTRNFAGTRHEIRKAIEAQKDLPATERDHLLRAIDMPKGLFGVDLHERDFD